MPDEETRKKIEAEIYSKNGKRGGDKTRELYGTAHFSEIGKKGAKGRKK